MSHHPERTARNVRPVNQPPSLSYVAKGLNNREIAEVMHVGRDCIKAHLKTIFAKLGVASRSEAAALAVNRSMVKV